MNWLETSDESIEMEMANSVKGGREGHVITTDGTAAIQTVASAFINADGSKRTKKFAYDENEHIEVTEDPKEARQFTLYSRPLPVLFQRRGRIPRVNRIYAFKAVDTVSGVTSEWTSKKYAIAQMETQNRQPIKS